VTRLAPVQPPRLAAALAVLAVVLSAAGCASPSSSSGPAPAAPSAAPRPTSSAAATTPTSPTPAAPTEPVSPPAGTVLVEIPEGGILLPVPAGWVQIPADGLADPAVRAEIAAKYPGADALLDQTTRLNGQASPAFLAVDPTAAARGDPLAANLSVMATQPSVGGPLLDIAVGFIADGMAETLQTTAPPVRERVPTQVGDAVRISMDIPPRDGHEIVATAWVIGAPRATLLITLLGPAEAVAGLDPATFAGALARSGGTP
jgi:hypothetical protein